MSSIMKNKRHLKISFSGLSAAPVLNEVLYEFRTAVARTESGSVPEKLGF